MVLDNALGIEKHQLRKPADHQAFPRASPFAQYLFLFPIAFDVNLTKVVDWNKDGAALQSIMVLCSTPFAKAARGVPFLSKKKECKSSYKMHCQF